MEEAPENGKESPHSVHANGLIDWYMCVISCIRRIPESDYYLWHVCLSSHWNSSSYHWTDFCDIWYL